MRYVLPVHFLTQLRKKRFILHFQTGLNGALDASRVKTYLKNSMYPLMYLFGKNSMPDVDNLLTSFYQLDDEARQEVVETIRLKLQYHRDPKRAEQIKQIKGW